MSKLRSNEFINAAGNGAPSFPQGATTIEPTADSQVATKSYVDNALFSVLGQTAPSLVPPTNPKIGSFWVDTSVSPSLLKVWNGTLWLEFSGTSGGVVSTSAIATPEVLTPANFSGFPDFSFAPQSSQITSVTNIDSDNIRLVIGDNTVSDNGSVIPGFTIDDMLSVGDSVYYAPYGKHHWISTLHSTIGDITGWACAVDSSDNIYTIGYIYEDSTLGSIVLTKHSSSGSLIWQRALSGAYKEYGYGIAVDTLNNVFITGETRSQSYSNRDMLIAKYDTDGDLKWTHRFGEFYNSTDVGKAVAVDNLGNSYYTGYITTGFGTTSQRTGIFIAKVDTDGNLQWQRELGYSATRDEEGNGITVDGDGNVYVVAEADSPSYTALILAKYNTHGDIQWSRSLTGNKSDSGYGVDTDSSGNVYVAGMTTDTNPYNNSSDVNALVLKYDPDGNIQWRRRLSMSTDTQTAQSIAVDALGNSYLGINHSASLNSSAGTGRYEFVIAKYDTNGVFQWTRLLSCGVQNDLMKGIALDNSGNFCVSGYTDSIGTNRSLITAKFPCDGTGTGDFGPFKYQTVSATDTDASDLTEDAVVMDSDIGDRDVDYGGVTAYSNTISTYDSAIYSVSGASGTITQFSGNTITLSGPIGTWSNGMSVIAPALTTVSGGISTTVTFTSSAPVGADGLIASWGNAEWQIAEDSGFTTNVQTVTSPLNTTITPITYNLTSNAQTGAYRFVGSDYSNTYNDSELNPSIIISVGDTLVFDNTSTYASHPMFIRDADGGASVSNPAPTGEGTGTVSWTPTVAGTYYYQCAVHPAMIGTITVHDILYPTQSGPTRGFTVDPNDPYYVRVRYGATDPAELKSQWSSSKYFKIVE